MYRKENKIHETRPKVPDIYDNLTLIWIINPSRRSCIDNFVLGDTTSAAFIDPSIDWFPGVTVTFFSTFSSSVNNIGQ